MLGIGDIGRVTSHRRVSPPPFVNNRVPSRLKAADLTSDPCPKVGPMGAPLTASHSRAMPSRDAVTMRVPSRLKLAETTWSPCLSSAGIRLPPVRFESLVVPYRGAVTNRVPSGLSANAKPPSLSSLCKIGGPIGAPPAASNNCTVPPEDTVTTHFPSGLNSACMWSSPCSWFRYLSAPSWELKTPIPFSPQTKKISPSRLKTTWTYAPPFRIRVRIGVFVPRFHNVAESSDIVRSRLLFLFITACKRNSSCGIDEPIGNQVW